MAKDTPKIGEDFEHFLCLPYPPLSGNHQYVTNYKTGGKKLRPEILAYRNQIRGYLVGRNLDGKKLQGPLWLEWQVKTPAKFGDKRADFDNMVKVVADALTQGGLWSDDDMRVAPFVSFRWIGQEGAGAVYLWIRPLPHTESEINALAGEEVPS